MDETVSRQVSKAAELIVRARIFLDAWWLSKGAEGRREYREFWEEYWNFWRFNEEALLCAYAVHIAALFDPKTKNTINLNRLTSEFWDNIESAAPSAVARGLDRANELAGKVKVLRSNLWAHRSAKIDYKDAFNKAQLTANDLRELTELSLVIVNSMLSALGGEEREFEASPISDLERLASSKIGTFDQ